ncbi:MAG: transglutaminase-like cysteine peptidase [Xanthobacteraceae bacterium]|nr:transglutaminase-like cysteine peptidase [Xanthobacteraceae bacterium]
MTLALAVIIHVTNAGAVPASTPTDSSSAAFAATEPFGLLTENVIEGPLHAKWQAAFASMAADIAIMSACEGQTVPCAASTAETQMFAIATAARERSGLALIGTVNRAVNLTIRPISDMAQYGVEDLWAAPLATMTSGAGDCEDYAIAKLALLRIAGVSASDLRLVILRNLVANEDHAVAAVHLKGDWYLLDNRHMMLVKDLQLDGFRPLFVLGFDGVRRFTEPLLVADAVRAAKPVAFAGDDATRLASATFLSIPPLGNDIASHSDPGSIWGFPLAGTL